MQNKRKLIVLLLRAGAGIVLLAGIAVVLVPRVPGWMKRVSPESMQPVSWSGRIQMDTVRMDRRVYDCGHESVTVTSIEAGMLGLTRSEFERKNPLLKVREFSPDRIEVETKSTEMCQECRAGQFIGVQEGYVTVFAGSPARPGPVLESTRILLTRLPQPEQNRLAKGIAIKDMSERLQILEGLSEYADR